MKTPEWIPVEERLPEKVKRILCLEKIYSDQYRYFVGFYTKGHEVEYDSDQEPEFDEIEEKNGCYYLKPGFYECEEQINDDDFFFKRPVTHWMPLPEHP